MYQSEEKKREKGGIETMTRVNNVKYVSVIDKSRKDHDDVLVTCVKAHYF